jgi:acyl carrier protein
MNARTAPEIETWMRKEIARALGIYANEIDVELPFEEIGLDSVTSLEVTGALEDWLQTSLSPRTFTEHRTIRKLAAHLARA